jgi:hypothetical protein
MPASPDAIAQDTLVLPPGKRLGLARQLLESVELESEPGAEAVYGAEVARRFARFKAGETKPIPAGGVFARLSENAPVPTTGAFGSSVAAVAHSIRHPNPFKNRIP